MPEISEKTLGRLVELKQQLERKEAQFAQLTKLTEELDTLRAEYDAEIQDLDPQLQELLSGGPIREHLPPPKPEKVAAKPNEKAKVAIANKIKAGKGKAKFDKPTRADIAKQAGCTDAEVMATLAAHFEKIQPVDSKGNPKRGRSVEYKLK